MKEDTNRNQDKVWFDTLVKLGGYYEKVGNGPLVGYQSVDEFDRQKVGMAYSNFAPIERNGKVLQEVAKELFFTGIIHHLNHLDTHGNQPFEYTGFCAAPGGEALAVSLQQLTGKDYIFPEKKVLVRYVSQNRSRLVWGRHTPERETSWWVVQDICHTFNTTQKLVHLLSQSGALVLGIVCFANHSTKIDREYTYTDETGIFLRLPVIALVRKPIEEYDPDAPEVADDVRRVNVVWKPEIEWNKIKPRVSRDKPFPET